MIDSTATISFGGINVYSYHDNIVKLDVPATKINYKESGDDA
jgi:hypothetical protein